MTYIDNRPTRPVPIVTVNGHHLPTRHFDDLLHGPSYKRRPPVWTIRRICRAAVTVPGAQVTRKVAGALLLGVCWWFGLLSLLAVSAGITILAIAAVLTVTAR